jgi:excisionase family DNA binding protein
MTMTIEHVETKPAQTKPETTTITAAAKRLKIGRNQAYESAARGELPVIRIGRRLLVPTAALDRMLRGETITSSNPSAPLRPRKSAAAETATSA